MKTKVLKKLFLLVIVLGFSSFAFSQNEEIAVATVETPISYDYNKDLFPEKEGNLAFSIKTSSVLSAFVVTENFDNLKASIQKAPASENVKLITENGITYIFTKNESYNGQDKTISETYYKKVSDDTCIILTHYYKLDLQKEYSLEGKKAILSAKVVK